MLTLFALLATSSVAQKKPADKPVVQPTTPVVSMHSAEDFFPLHEGDEYQFEDKIGKQLYGVSEKVGAQRDIGGTMVTPMVIDTGAAKPEIDYYVVDKTTVKHFEQVQSVKRDDKGLTVTEDGRPVTQVESYQTVLLKLPEAGKEWASVGKTIMNGYGASLNLRGTSEYLGQREVLGQKRDVLKVVLDFIGGASDGPPVNAHAEYYYAKGIGLYEMHDRNNLGKKLKGERVRTLLAYIPNKGQ